MIVLALEFSSSIRSVAILESSPARAPGKASVLSCTSDAGAQAARPFTLIERALTEARVEREAIACSAVGLGPGSYTGIRSSIAIAQGWQLARQVTLSAVSSVEALGLQAQQLGWYGLLHFAIDAQRGEFYVADYEITETKLATLQPLRLAKLAEVQRLSDSGEIVAGPGLQVRLPQARDLFPNAAAIGLLAAGRDGIVSGEKLEPIYLRETAFVKAPPPRHPGT